MKSFSAILVPFDGSRAALGSLDCAAWLAARIGASLHVLNAGHVLPEQRALDALGVPAEYRALVRLHQTPGPAVDSILAALRRHEIDLVVLSARGRSLDDESEPQPAARVVGSVARELLEAAGVPVLLVPPGYRMEPPWRSVLVPISGEPATDESLALALRLADALELAVTVAHVADGAGPVAGLRSAAHSDQPHHEYPQLLNEFVARACPMCSASERSRIADLQLLEGDIAPALRKLVAEQRISLLVVGWHGTFMAGHAAVVKSLIRHVACPVLLMKPKRRARSRLKVGENFG